MNNTLQNLGRICKKEYVPTKTLQKQKILGFGYFEKFMKDYMMYQVSQLFLNQRITL